MTMSKNEPLTARMALVICRELWQWMQDTRQSRRIAKWNWPGWLKYGHFGKGVGFFSSCPCCEFNYQNNDRFCGSTCLLAGVWGKDEEGEVGCDTPPSPYYCTNSVKDVAECAQAIVTECNRLLSDSKWGIDTKEFTAVYGPGRKERNFS